MVAHRLRWQSLSPFAARNGTASHGLDRDRLGVVTPVDAFLVVMAVFWCLGFVGRRHAEGRWLMIVSAVASGAMLFVHGPEILSALF